MKKYWGSEGIAQTFINSTTSPPEKETPVPIDNKFEWAPEPI
jgi:hypothetical protein